MLQGIKAWPLSYLTLPCKTFPIQSSLGISQGLWHDPITIHLPLYPVWLPLLPTEGLNLRNQEFPFPPKLWGGKSVSEFASLGTRPVTAGVKKDKTKCESQRASLTA